MELRPTMTDPITRYEFQDLERRVGANERRIEDIDHGGTRGVAVLAVQVQDIIKSVAELKRDMETHETKHITDRRWAISILIAFIAAIGGLYPFLIVLLQHGHA